MTMLAFTFLCLLGSPGQPLEPFTLSAIEWPSEGELPSLKQLEESHWEDRGPREKVFQRQNGLIFDLEGLELGSQGAWVLRLNHSRLGFQLHGFSQVRGGWEPIEIRARLPLGMVLTPDQLTPFSYLSIRNTGTLIGILNLHRMSQVDVIRSVNSHGTLQLIVFGVFAFIVVCPILLWVFFGRSVYGWYCLYLFGGWLVVWVAAPGNSTIPPWIEDWFPINALGLSSSAIGLLGLLRSTFFEQISRSLRSWIGGCLRGLIVGLLPGLLLAPALLEGVSGLLLECASLILAPYLLFIVKSQRSWRSLWLFGLVVSNVLALAIGIMELAGDGVSAEEATLGLVGIVGLHLGLLALFVADDFGTQKTQLTSLKLAVDEDKRRLTDLELATARVTSELEEERDTQRRLVAERREANARLDVVNETLKLSFERMIETKRYATLGGFWPQFSRALTGGMERLRQLRLSIDPALDMNEHSDLVRRMDTALDSCWAMAEAVEGALEFEVDRTTELQRVASMAVTLLGWSADDPTLQLRTETDLRVPGAHAEWLQLVMNLLANARQALKESGGERPDQGRVVLTGRKIAQGVEIVVEDSGPGWTPELLRLNSTDILDETHLRSGLGLSICATICKRYNATMVLRESSLGGAAVVVEIPALGLDGTA
ncbi:MAG: sensor histidine kinase [Myxococcota bacterium]|nr:sensor histidine kinase [Myxococcota bacterium]